MAVKKTVPAKKKATAEKPAPVNKAAAAIKKAAPAKNAAKTIKKGARYECAVCGMLVTVDYCGRVGFGEILCCGKPMKAKTTK